MHSVSRPLQKNERVLWENAEGSRVDFELAAAVSLFGYHFVDVVVV